MINWLVIYKENDGVFESKARIKATSYGKALEKAESTIKEMNYLYKEKNSAIYFSLARIENYDAIEDWTNV